MKPLRVVLGTLRAGALVRCWSSDPHFARGGNMPATSPRPPRVVAPYAHAGPRHLANMQAMESLDALLVYATQHVLALGPGGVVWVFVQCAHMAQDTALTDSQQDAIELICRQLESNVDGRKAVSRFRNFSVHQLAQIMVSLHVLHVRPSARFYARWCDSVIDRAPSCEPVQVSNAVLAAAQLELDSQVLLPRLLHACELHVWRAYDLALMWHRIRAYRRHTVDGAVFDLLAAATIPRVAAMRIKDVAHVLSACAHHSWMSEPLQDELVAALRAYFANGALATKVAMLMRVASSLGTISGVLQSEVFRLVATCDLSVYDTSTLSAIWFSLWKAGAIDEPPLLTPLAAASVSRLHAMDHVTLVTVVAVCGAYRLLHTELLDGWFAVAPQMLHHCNAVLLSRIVVGLAKLGIVSVPADFMDTWLAVYLTADTRGYTQQVHWRLLRQLKSIGLTPLVPGAYAFYERWGSLCDWSRCSPDDLTKAFTFMSLSGASLEAFGGYPLLAEWVSACQPALSELRPTGLAEIAASLKRFGNHLELMRPDFRREFLRAVEEKLSVFTPNDAGHLLMGLVSRAGPPIAAQSTTHFVALHLQTRALETLAICAPTELIMMMYGLAKLLPPEQLVSQLVYSWAAICNARVSEFDSRDLAITMWTLVRLQIYPIDVGIELFRGLGRYCTAMMPHFSVASLSQVLGCVVYLQLTEDELSPGFFDALRATVAERLLDMPIGYVVIVLHCLTMLESGGVPSAVSMPSVRDAIAGLDRRASVLTIEELYLAGLAARWFGEPFYAAPVDELRRQPPPQPSLVMDVPEAKQRVFMDEILGYVDIYVESTKTVIWVDTATRFTRVGALVPHERLLGRLLERAGFHVVRIDARSNIEGAVEEGTFVFQRDETLPYEMRPTDGHPDDAQLYTAQRDDGPPESNDGQERDEREEDQ